MSSEADAVVEHDFEVTNPSKAPIICSRFTCDLDSASLPPSLIFTHGSGGTLKSDAIANFAHGFATQSPIVCFQGNMNLNARVKSFEAICKHESFSNSLGGRSMGARAAVMSATEDTARLVLVSYPLHTGQQTRDQILVDLPKSVDVIFVTGESDNMCDLERLNQVRSRMVCETWLVVVDGADHGMNVKPRAGTKAVGVLTGEVVAQWQTSRNKDQRYGRIWWDKDQSVANWSGWSNTAKAERGVSEKQNVTTTPISTKNPTKKRARDPEQSSERSKRKVKRSRR